jgi:hypothetical protein
MQRKRAITGRGSILARTGKDVLKMARDIGTDVVAEVIGEKMKEQWRDFTKLISNAIGT